MIFILKDVVPFVPVQNATMADCIDIAREFAERLAMELNVPVYLYGEAQEKDYRRDLSQIREGEYEALYNKVKKMEKLIFEMNEKNLDSKTRMETGLW